MQVRQAAVLKGETVPFELGQAFRDDHDGDSPEDGGDQGDGGVERQTGRPVWKRLAVVLVEQDDEGGEQADGEKGPDGLRCPGRDEGTESRPSSGHAVVVSLAVVSAGGGLVIVLAEVENSESRSMVECRPNLYFIRPRRVIWPG